MRNVLLVLGMSAFAVPASAKGILVLKVEQDGLSSAAAEAAETGIRNGVFKAKKGALLAAPALDFSGMQLAAGCVDDGPACLAGMGIPLKASRVVRTRITGTDAKAKLEITVVRVSSKRAKVHRAELEGLDGESAALFSHHAQIAMGAKPPPLTGTVTIRMASNVGSLDGAEFFLDDKKVPRTAFQDLPPGDYRIDVHQKGFEPFVQYVKVRPGVVTPLGVEFKPRTKAPPPPVADATPPVSGGPPPPVDVAPPPSTTVDTTPSTGKPIVWTFVLGGLAVAACAVGVTYVVLGDPVHQDVLNFEAAMETRYNECRSGAAGEDCDKLRQDIDFTRQAAIGNIAGFVTAGVLAATAVGIFFVEWDQSDPDSGSDLSLGIAPTDGGIASSLSLSF